MNQKDISKRDQDNFALPKENYTYLLVGFVVIIIGFAITLAPIVVLIGFIFEMWAIMRKPSE